MACRCAKPVFLRNRFRLGATVASTSTSGRTAAEQHAGRARRNARSCSAAANGNSQTPHDLPALILKKNAENAIMVYSKSWCPFCHEAKRVLSTAVEAAKGDAARLTVVELDALADGDDVQDALMSITGARRSERENRRAELREKERERQKGREDRVRE